MLADITLFEKPCLSGDEIAFAHDAIMKSFERLDDKDDVRLLWRSVNIVDMPIPRALSATAHQLENRALSLLGKGYRLLSKRVIINMPRSEAQKPHRDIDQDNSVVVFMVPLVDVTKEIGSTEVFTAKGSVYGLCKAGVPYMFNAYAMHRATANISKKPRPAIVLDFCVNEYFEHLSKDKLYLR